VAERRVEIRVTVDDADANAKLDKFAAKLKKIAGDWTIKLRLDDAGAGAKLDKMAAQLDRMSSKRYESRFGISGLTEANAELDKTIAKLKEINGYSATAAVRVRSNSSSLRNTIDKLAQDTRKGALGRAWGGLDRGLNHMLLGDLFKGGGSAAGGAGGAGGGFLSFLGGANNQYAGIGIGALVALAAAVAPGLVPFALGGGVGGLGAIGALMTGAHGAAQIQQDTQALALARAAYKLHPNPVTFLQRKYAGQALQESTGLYQPFQPFGRQVDTLQNTFFSSFARALTSKGPGFSGGPGGHPGTSFLQGLAPIMQQLANFMKQLSPLMGQLFRASLPFVEAFLKIMIQFAKVVMPSVLQSMKMMLPYMPIMMQGFKELSVGIADFIKNLGPGMKEGAIIFKGAMFIVKLLLQQIGIAASDFAIAIVKTAEGIRTFARNLPHWFDVMFHTIASLFDTWRHGWAHIWDMVFSDTIGAVIRIDRGIINWFEKVPKQVQNALRGLGQMLENIGKLALSMLLSGLKAAAGPVINFVQNLGHSILHIFDVAIGRHSPSKAFFAAGEDIMRGLYNGIQSHERRLQSKVSGIGGNVVSWITAALRATGKPMSWLPALERLVSLESGGNPRAINPISVMGEHATGLWQMLPSTFAGEGGRGGLMGMFNPIIEGVAALRYISGRYGSPFNIPGLFGGGYQGYATGGIITEPILGRGLRTGMTYGFGENGIRERVTPLSGGGGSAGTYLIFNVQGDTNPDAAAMRILKILRQYKTRHGGLALNLG
jgi:Transglycosylase SLT domain